MPIKDIVTIVDLSGSRPAADYALGYGQAYNAHVTGLTLVFEPVLPAFASAPVPADYIQSLKTQALAAARTAANTFMEMARRTGVNSESRIEKILTGESLETLTRHCRATDVVVIGQNDPEKPEPMRDLLIETVLFESGVPVLLVPYIGSKAGEPKNILIGWDGSTTATKAVHAALPLLERADRTTVLAVEKRPRTDIQPGTDIATYLARHGMNVTVDVIHNPQIGVGDTLLNYVADNGNDLVVMGGYGHSRFREYLFGGATRDILAAMTVPVLMAH